MATDRYLACIDDLVEMFGLSSRTELPARIDAWMNAARDDMSAANPFGWSWRTNYRRLYGQSETVAIDSLFDGGKLPADYGIWRVRARLGVPGNGDQDSLITCRVSDVDAYWKITNSSGTTLTDATENGNNLTISGSPVFSAVGDHYGLTFPVKANPATAYAGGALSGVASTTASRSFVVQYTPTAIRPGYEEGLLWTGDDDGGAPGMALAIVWTATSPYPEFRCYVGPTSGSDFVNCVYWTLPELYAGSTYLFFVTFNASGTTDNRWTLSVNGSPLNTPGGHRGTVPTVNQTIDYAVIGALRDNATYSDQAYGTISQVAIIGDVLTDADIARFIENYWYEAESSVGVDYVEKSAITRDSDFNREADYEYAPSKFTVFSDAGTNTLDFYPGLYPGRNLCIDLWYAAELTDIDGNDGRDTVTSTVDSAFIWPTEFDRILTKIVAMDLAMWKKNTEVQLLARSGAERALRAQAVLEGVDLSELTLEGSRVARRLALLEEQNRSSGETA